MNKIIALILFFSMQGFGATVSIKDPTADRQMKVNADGSINVGASVTQSTIPWITDVTQFGNNNVVTGIGTSGLGIPRFTISNDSNILATQSGAWTTGRTWTLLNTTDSVNAVQSGTWTTGRTWVLVNTSDSVNAVQSGAWTTGRTWTLSNNTDSVNAVQSGTWTVQQGSTPTTIANAWPVKPTDGTSVITIKPASTASATTDTSEVVALSPNSPLPTGTNNVGSITNVTGVVSLPTGASTLAAQNTGNTSLASIDSKLADNYGVATGAARTASQIGNTAGQADFNEGANSAQTLRTSSNIARNGNELTYNIGAPDANTLRSAAILSNSTGQVDYNDGASSAQTQRTSSNVKFDGTTPALNAGATNQN